MDIEEQNSLNLAILVIALVITLPWIVLGVDIYYISKEDYYVCDCEQQQKLHQAISRNDFYRTKKGKVIPAGKVVIASGPREVLTVIAKIELNTLCDKAKLTRSEYNKLKDDSCKFLYDATFGELRK